MSEVRILMVFAEKRVLSQDEDRELDIRLDRRVLDIQEEDRALEVYLP